MLRGFLTLSAAGIAQVSGRFAVFLAHDSELWLKEVTLLVQIDHGNRPWIAFIP